MDGFLGRVGVRRFLVSLALILATTLALAVDTKYVGSANSNKYRYQASTWATRITPTNLVKVEAAKEARAAWYVPCEVCNPPVYE